MTSGSVAHGSPDSRRRHRLWGATCGVRVIDKAAALAGAAISHAIERVLAG